MSGLRDQLIKLGSSNRELRPHLKVILAHTGKKEIVRKIREEDLPMELQRWAKKKTRDLEREWGSKFKSGLDKMDSSGNKLRLVLRFETEDDRGYHMWSKEVSLIWDTRKPDQVSIITQEWDGEQQDRAERNEAELRRGWDAREILKKLDRMVR